MKELFRNLRIAFNNPKAKTLEIYGQMYKTTIGLETSITNPDKLGICSFAKLFDNNYNIQEFQALLKQYRTVPEYSDVISLYYFKNHAERKYVINRIYFDLIKQDFTLTLEDLAYRNMFNTNYFFKTCHPYEHKFNLEEESNYVIRDLEKDLEILHYRCGMKIKSEEEGKILMGDAVRMSDGSIEFVCHVYEDTIQTYPGGSFCLLNEGSLTHSGSLNDSFPISKLELTDERYPLNIWFPHKGWLQAGSAIHAVIPVRLWQHKKQIIK